MLYNNGRSYESKSGKDTSSLRKEYGLFMFRYELCNIGNIRKMHILLPHLNKVNLDPINSTKSLDEDDLEDNEEELSHCNFRMMIQDIRPKIE